MRRGILVAFVLAFALIMTACPKTPYGRAAALGLDVTDAIHTGADAIDQLQKNGTISKDDEKVALQYLDALNSLDVDVYGPCVISAHKAGDKPAAFAGCATGMADAISDPGLEAKFRIVNPISQAKVRTIAQAVKSLIQTTISGFGVAKPATN